MKIYLSLIYKTIAKSSELSEKFIIYLSTTAIQAGINYILASFFSHKLSIKEFGEYNLYISLLPVFTTFIILGLDSALNLYYHKLDKIKYKILLFNIFFIALPSSILILFFIFPIIGEYLSNIFNLKIYIVFILFLIASIQSYILSYLSYLQTKGNAKKYFKVFTFNIILGQSIGLVLYLLFPNLIVYFVGIFLVNILVFIYILISLKDLIVIKFDFSLIKKALRYGTFLIPNAIGSYIFFMSDRYFISYYYGNEEVAYYSVSVYIGGIILMINHAFVKAWNPFLFKHLKNFSIENKIKIVKLSYLVFVFYLVVCLLLIGLKGIIFNIFFDKKLIEGLKYTNWIIIGYTFVGFFKVFSGYLFFLEKVKLISAISMFIALLNIILNYFFIKKYGSLGVAYATALSMFIFSLIIFIIVQYKLKLPWLKVLKNES